MTRRTTTSRPSSAGLGTFAGVFTPSVLTILGLVLFRRLGYLPWERVPVDALDTAAALMGDELGWSEDAREREKRSVLRE